ESHRFSVRRYDRRNQMALSGVKAASDVWLEEAREHYNESRNLLLDGPKKGTNTDYSPYASTEIFCAGRNFQKDQRILCRLIECAPDFSFTSVRRTWISG